MAISVVVKFAVLTGLPTPVAISLAIGSGVASGLACHECLEKPVTAFLKTRRHRRDKARYAV
jgi:exopolysaccharide production protein ExoZ